MRFSTLSESRYLKKEDCGDDGLLVTIKEYCEENVAPNNSPPEMKWVVYFLEQEKGLVLNVTNGNMIAQITNAGDDSAISIGHKIILYSEPNVTNPAGKLVGGIRVRAPKKTAPGGPDPAIVAILTTAAASGLDALQQIWQTLTNPQKKSALGIMPKLKADALANDQGVGDPFDPPPPGRDDGEIQF